MNVGDVHWVQMPGGGHAQAGRRPAIVMQSEAATLGLPTVLVAPLTTQLNAARFPGTVLVEANAGNGLRQNSVALIFQMTALDRRFVEAPLGAVTDAVLAAIWQAFDRMTDRV